jgi:hypothetical protein
LKVDFGHALTLEITSSRGILGASHRNLPILIQLVDGPADATRITYENDMESHANSASGFGREFRRGEASSMSQQPELWLSKPEQGLSELSDALGDPGYSLRQADLYA